jgi:hypothetical protein
METKNNKGNREFHAVEFMRQVRAELTELFLKDKQKYLDYLKQAMADFKAKQNSAYS